MTNTNQLHSGDVSQPAVVKPSARRNRRNGKMAKQRKSKKVDRRDHAPETLRESSKKMKLIEALKKKQLTKAEASKVVYKKLNLGALNRVLKGVKMAADARLIPGYKFTVKEAADGERMYRLAGRSR
jgi:hypothetical protein